MADSGSEKVVGLNLGTFGYTIANILVIYGLSYLVWVLFVDPQIGLWKLYPQPFGVYLFWGILVLVWIGFDLELFGFTDIKQPMRGLILFAVTTAISFGFVKILLFGYGRIDPAFSLEGAGYTALGMIVLIGFYTFTIIPTSMDNWPWKDLGLKQPWLGVAGLFSGFFLTVMAYLLLIYPSLATWTSPDRVVMSLPTAVGWFYSVIVGTFTIHLLFENRLWIATGSRASRALSALTLNFLIGTVVYFVFLALLKSFLIPAEAQVKIGAAINLWPAHLGVWVLSWMLVWALIAGNSPTQLGPLMNGIVRTVIVYGLGILSFVIYMGWFAMEVLHEAPIVSGFGGDPLTWVDLVNYVLLIWVAYFGCYGINKKES